jgi:hypothetical protein
MTGSGLIVDHRLIARLAREVEEGDPIDWDGLALDREAVYDMIASQVAEMIRGYGERGVGHERQTLILLATVVKLTVENFVLHRRVLEAKLPRRE